MLKNIAILIITLSLLFTSVLLTAQYTSSHSSGIHNGYIFEFKAVNGTGNMNCGNNASFRANWGQSEKILAKIGKRPGAKNLVAHFNMNYQAQGKSRIGGFGKGQAEFNIIENWTGSRPQGSKVEGTVFSDGGIYDIYKIDGHFWSVRQSKRTKGSITFINHFKAWEKKGMKIGNLSDVSFGLKAFNSKGSVNVFDLYFTPKQ